MNTDRREKKNWDITNNGIEKKKKSSNQTFDSSVEIIVKIDRIGYRIAIKGTQTLTRTQYVERQWARQITTEEKHKTIYEQHIRWNKMNRKFKQTGSRHSPLLVSTVPAHYRHIIYSRMHIIAKEWNEIHSVLIYILHMHNGSLSDVDDWECATDLDTYRNDFFFCRFAREWNRDSERERKRNRVWEWQCQYNDGRPKRIPFYYFIFLSSSFSLSICLYLCVYRYLSLTFFESLIVTMTTTTTANDDDVENRTEYLNKKQQPKLSFNLIQHKNALFSINFTMK